MESWDDENFEPREVTTTVAITSNRWEGEDEEEDVKESWEDEEEEKEKDKDKDKEKEKENKSTAAKPKKKSLAEKIAEKERMKKEELERKLLEQQEEEITPEEQLRRQKESDLNLALETTFDGSITNNTGIDNFDPTNKEEFQEYAEMITKKILPHTKHAEYPVFAENLIRNLCASLNSFDIKKIKTTIDNLYLEKQKIEKGEKVKKNKGKGKAKLKLEDDNHLSAYVDDYNDYDDFM